MQEVKDRAEVAARQQAEEIVAEANRNAQIIEEEAKQKALQFLVRASESLLGTAETAASPTETPPPTSTELKPDTASKEKLKGPVQIEKETKEKSGKPDKPKKP